MSTQYNTNSSPSDRFNVVYIIFYLLGITLGLPWYILSTAKEYWMYKFRDISENHTSYIELVERSDLQVSFSSYISMASDIPSTIFLVITPVIINKISLKVCILCSLAAMLVLFTITTIFVELNTDDWRNIFFLSTIIITVLLNIAGSILHSGLSGLIGRFPARYITANVSGQALGGIFAALAEIFSIWIGASPIRSAFVYFIVTDAFIMISILAYTLLYRSIFFKYYAVDYTPQDELPIKKEISYMTILKRIWVLGMAAFFGSMITLSMYPAITALVNSQYHGNHSPWNDIYFAPVIAFLLYSVMDYLGRLFAGFLQKPEKQSWVVGLFSLLRVGFIPLLLLCNAHPRHHLPVLITNDICYILIIAAFGFSNGYMASITMICVPKLVELHEQETASSMMSAFFGIGLAVGSFLSLCFVKLI